MKLFRLLMVLAALALGISTVAQANDLSYVENISLPNFLTTSSQTDFCNSTNYSSANCTFTLPDFSLPEGDTLTGVTITVTWDGTTTLSLYDTSYTNLGDDYYGTINTSMTAKLVYNGSTIGTQVIGLPTSQQSFCIGTADDCSSDAPGATYTDTDSATLDIGPFNGSGSVTYSPSVTSPLVTALLNGDTVQMSSYTKTQVAAGNTYENGGNSGASQTTDGYVSAAQIVYYYDSPVSPAPEPATCGLFGSALAGLIVFRKRFKR